MVLHEKREREKNAGEERKDRETWDTDNTKGKHKNFNKPKNLDKMGFAGGGHFAVPDEKFVE
jgi:hypothetical protein